MRASYNMVDDDLRGIEEEDRQTRQRRVFAYSAAALTAAEAVEAIYVAHEEFRVALESLDRIFNLARRLKTPQGALIEGPTGSGKSTLIDFFLRTIQPDSLFETGAGAITVRLQHRPTPGSTVSALLAAIKYPFPNVAANTVYQKRNLLIEALLQKGTRQIMIDEAQNLATQLKARGPAGDSSTAADILCHLMDSAGVGLVLCARDQLDLQRVDPALASRVSVRLRFHDLPTGAGWTAFVEAYCRQSQGVSLDFLKDKAQIALLHQATGGNLRAFKRLVTEAVLVAVDEAQGVLSPEVLLRAFTRVSGKSNPRANPYLVKKEA